MRATEKITVLYCRLSQEDERQGESLSIENQKIFYGTHEAIIEQEVFDKVQKLRKHRQRADRTGKTSLFSGLVYCMDCGKRMYFCSRNGDSPRSEFFCCATNSMRSEQCNSSHYIREKVLKQIVWKHMSMVMECVACHEDYFRSQMEKKFQMESADVLKSLRKQLAKSEKRVRELDALFIRIYEDNVSGFWKCLLSPIRITANPRKNLDSALLHLGRFLSSNEYKSIKKSPCTQTSRAFHILLYSQ